MRRIVLTGCSGGGKSSLLAALSERGFATVTEPGRRVIAAERAAGSNGFPWSNEMRFAELAFAMAWSDYDAAEADPTIFDRSALDQAAWFGRQGLTPPGPMPVYDRDIIVAPPWPEIFTTNANRRHGFDDARAEFEDLMRRLPVWGYRCHLLPKLSVDARVDWVTRWLAGEGVAA